MDGSDEAEEQALAVLMMMSPEASEAEDEMRYLASMLGSTATADLAECEESVSEMLEGIGVSDPDQIARKVVLTLATKRDDGGTDGPAVKDSGWKRLEAPVVLAESAGKMEDPVIRETLAASLAKKMLGNSPIDVVEREVKLTKAQAARKSKAASAAAAARTWNENPYEDMKADALRTYLEARCAPATRDVVIGDYTLYKPGSTEKLLDGTTLKLVHGQRYGLAGRNGVGKSTLLREIASYRIAGFPHNVKVMHVEQESRGTERTVLQTVVESDLEREYLLKREKLLSQLATVDRPSERKKLGIDPALCHLDPASVADMQQQVASQLEDIQSHTAESRASAVLRGLQFTEGMLHVPTKTLSGGWRMRVALASALFIVPDLLLLDEPTNHLDFPSVLWLERYLKKDFHGTLLVVSHDRTFLNSVATDMILLSQNRLTTYPGNFDNYLKVRADRRAAQQRAYDAQQLEIKHMQEYIDKFYNDKRSSAQAARVKQAMSKKKALEKMERIPDPSLDVDPDAIKLHFPEPAPIKKDVIIEASDLSFAWEKGAPLLLKNVSVQIGRNSRIGVLGANGAGKSTLLQLLLGELKPTAGNVRNVASCSVAVFAQHHVDQLDLAMTPVECMRARFAGFPVQECRSYLGRFGITGSMATTQMGWLSGGQKSRVVLALLCKRLPALIVLDEPTNHLDAETIDVLIEALREFKGAVIMVSHDQYFLSQVATEFWSVGQGEHSVSLFHDMEEAKRSTYKSYG